MIAPLRETETATLETRQRLHRARQLIASTLLRPDPYPEESARPVAPWRAWLFAAWVVVVTAVYLAYMAGWL